MFCATNVSWIILFVLWYCLQGGRDRRAGGRGVNDALPLLHALTRLEARGGWWPALGVCKGLRELRVVEVHSLREVLTPVVAKPLTTLTCLRIKPRFVVGEGSFRC